LTAVDKKENISNNSDNTKTEKDKKFTKVWQEVTCNTTKNRSNIEITGIKNSKPRKVICIEILDSDKKSENNKATELDNKKQVL
jgi:hypothetical protein